MSQENTDKEYRSIWKYLYRFPHRLDWIDVKGVSTRYIELGKDGAPCLILLHGTAGSLENFCANLGPLSEHFHVFAIDMLGCGWTDKPDFPYTARSYATHACDFMDALGIATASFIGVSLGSWIAYRLACDFPGRVEKIIGVAPAGLDLYRNPSAEDRRRIEIAVSGSRQRRTKATGNPTWSNVREVFTNLLLHEEDVIDDLVAIRLDIYRNPEMQSKINNVLNQMNGEGSIAEDEWEKLDMPILTIAAVDADNIFLSNAYRIAEVVPDGTVIEMTGVDHWAQFERPDAFNDISIRFLQGAPIPGRI